MSKLEIPSQNRAIKTRRRLYSFLAFRVLFVSVVFIVVPLIFYLLIIFTQGYGEKLSNVFEDLKLYQENQINSISQMEVDYLNFVDSFYKMVRLLDSDPSSVDKRVTMILADFAERNHLTGVSYLTLTKEGKILCTDTTQPLYKGVNFTQYFDISKLDAFHDNIFIGKDPVFKESLYVSYNAHDENGKIVGFVVITVALEQLIDQLSSLPSNYETNLSVLDSSYYVLSSTEPTLEGITFTQNEEDGGTKIILKAIEEKENGFKFTYLDQKRFGLIARFPHTSNYLFLSMPASIVLYELTHYIWQLSLFLIFIVVIGGVSSFLLAIRISKPLAQLGNVMTKVGEGDLTPAFRHDPMGFEINYLGDQFNSMVTSLLTHIDEVQKERAQKEAIEKEFQIGHEIQNSILPAKEVSFPGMKVSIYFKAAKEVAADFFDWIVTECSLFITVADGVGKGISSCLYSVDLRSILRSFALSCHDLKDIISETNRLFCLDTKDTGNFVTAFVTRFYKETNTLQFANCGHNHPFLKRKDGTVQRLYAKGMAFGVEPFQVVDVQEVTLEVGDFIILYTDGINEAQNKNLEIFGEVRLEEVIRSSKATTSEALLKEIVDAINVFTAGFDQFDDMTLVVAEVQKQN